MDRMFPTTSALIPVLSALGRKLPGGSALVKREQWGTPKVPDRSREQTGNAGRHCGTDSQLFWTFS